MGPLLGAMLEVDVPQPSIGLIRKQDTRSWQVQKYTLSPGESWTKEQMRASVIHLKGLVLILARNCITARSPGDLGGNPCTATRPAVSSPP